MSKTSPTDTALTDLVAHLARSLVDDASAVQVRAFQDEGTTVVELRVAREDLGKVIGRRGNTARAIRTVLAAASVKRQRRAVLNIIED